MFILFAIPYSAEYYYTQDTDSLSGYAQHRIISEILHDAWFLNKAALGVEFSDYFKPIPLNTLALIFSVVSVR